MMSVPSGNEANQERRHAVCSVIGVVKMKTGLGVG